MHKLDFIDRHLKQQALERFDYFGELPITTLMSPSAVFQQVPEERIDFLQSHQDGISQWLRHNVTPVSQGAMLDFFMRHILDYLYRHNQYLTISPQRQRHLQAVYARFIRDYLRPVCTLQDSDTLRQELASALAGHQLDLAQVVAEIGHDNGGLTFALAEPVCSQYSPELQLALLSLDDAALLDPILDLGCGRAARLVEFLRDLGQAVCGIDRSAVETPHVFKMDWFTFPLEHVQWGTVLSHMAFSVHFLHHHLRRGGQPERYAQRYMAILRALKIGGCFAYTPGLPFVENLLPPDQYHVERYLFEQTDLNLPDVASLVGDVNYTAIITRHQ